MVHVLNEAHGAMADFLPHALPADQHGAALLEVIAFQDVQGFAGLDGLGQACTMNSSPVRPSLAHSMSMGVGHPRAAL